MRQISKFFKVISVFSLIALAACQNGANGGFVPNLQDVPLPEGFTADPGMSSFFDSAEGRIAEVHAKGVASPEEVNKFYTKTLPQLGWKKIDDLIYSKEGELLGIDVSRGKEITNITYSLKPGVNI